MDNNLGASPFEEEKPRSPLIILAILGIVAAGCCAVFIGAYFLFQPDKLSLIDKIFPSPTATQTNTPTPTVTPNLTATQQIVESTATAESIQALATDSFSQWPVLITETFDSNKSKWPVGSDNDEYAAITREVTGGTYNWDITAKKGFISWISASKKPLSDFNLSVDVKRVSGSTNFDYGVIFREDANGNFYYFGITDKEFLVSLNNNNVWTDLIPFTASSAILPGETNRLTIIAKGSHFVFFINDQFVGEATDNQIQKGKAAIAVEVHETGVKTSFVFDNLELRTP